MRHLLTALMADPRGASLLAALSFYVTATTRGAPEQVRQVLDDHLPPETKTTMTNPLVRALNKAKKEGRIEGEARGEARGRAEGEARGRADPLLRLLDRRFGAAAAPFADRVRAAALADLDRWTDRVLDAGSVAQVFADD